MSLREIDDFQFFVLLARHASMSAAARELGVSVAQVSKRLARIEDSLGVVLAQRSSRGLVLTPEGTQYAEGAKDIRRRIDELESFIAQRRTELSGEVSILSTPGIARSHIGPLLADLSAAMPGLELRLELSSHPVGADLGGCDLAIRVGSLPDSRLHALKIAENRRVLCAAPAYIRSRTSPEVPGDLRDHDCLVLRENDSDFAVWRFVPTAGGPEESVTVSGPLTSNDGDVVTDWALAGRGIVRRSSWHVASMLRDGALVELMPRYTTVPDPIFALHPAPESLPSRVRVVLDHLARELPARLDPASPRTKSTLAARDDDSRSVPS